MRKHALYAVVILAGCSSSNDDSHRAKVKAALDASTVSLSDAVQHAEDSEKLSTTQASLVLAQPSFRVVLGPRAVDLDKNGVVLRATESGTSAAACPGATTAKDAIGIAVRATGGSAIHVVPDDDDACLFEVQTFSGSKIWEVKIDRNGTILEKEDATDDEEDDD